MWPHPLNSPTVGGRGEGGLPTIYGKISLMKNNQIKFSLSWQIISLSEKVSFAGRVIPAGTGLMSNIYAAHTDPEVIFLS